MSHDREQFRADELAICLSHYDLGVLERIREFPRGSRRAPKVVIDSERGRFLLKRRAKGKDELPKVAFTHEIQLALAAQNFPLPHLLGTRRENNSMLVRDGHIYELFEFIDGRGYDRSLEATQHAGHTLGLYHKLLADFDSDYEPSRGSYHNAGAIRQSIGNTVQALPLDARPPAEELTSLVEALDDAYRTCTTAAEEAGLGDWPRQIVHGDWHPGNMLFRERRVVAVIDYDSARLQPPVIDLANGALQFSIVGRGEDVDAWPDAPDLGRLKRFVRGYDEVNVLSRAELHVVPYLMCEAMIAEAVLPIAATGSFGRMEGYPFLAMVGRKVRYILEHVDELHSTLED